MTPGRKPSMRTSASAASLASSAAPSGSLRSMATERFPALRAKKAQLTLPVSGGIQRR